ncbi:MAG: DNA primase [Rhodospirillales bacterium]|jgi:DNA primase|nr:DNA primase [Rhodospirillales bacterium]
MASFTPQFLDELRTRVPLEDVIGRRVKLIRRGREYVGLSPFQKEKTPSFTVIPDKGFYHCFSSGENGDVIDFVMKTEGLNFPEAVERLAAEAGMEIPVDSPEEREKAAQRQSLYDVLEAAAAYFEKMLRMPEGRDALAYLKDRGLSDETISRFRLGFAPDLRNGIKGALAREGIGEDLLLAAGLIRQPDDGRPAYDYFRRRVVFPIMDRRGRIIAFGGRILGDGEPKYLNSPESGVFLKRFVLYGLGQALKAARERASIIVTEGYMDVIALHQAGFEHAVAPLGTALTEDQIKEMWRIVAEPILCFDGDKAGQKAALRVAERTLPLLKSGYGLRFATMPPGEDPDSLIKAAGPRAMTRVLDATKPFSEVLWQMETAGKTKMVTPEERAALQSRLEKHAAQIVDPIVRQHFSGFIRDRVWQLARGSGKERGRGRRQGRGQPYDARPSVIDKPGPAVDGIHRIQQVLLASALNHPHLFDQIGERLGMIACSDPDLDELRQATVAALSAVPELDAGGLRTELDRLGHGARADALLNDPLISAHRPIQPGAPDHEVLETWEENYESLLGDERSADVKLVKDEQPEDLTAEKWAILRAKINEAVGNDEA